MWRIPSLANSTVELEVPEEVQEETKMSPISKTNSDLAHSTSLGRCRGLSYLGGIWNVGMLGRSCLFGEGRDDRCTVGPTGTLVQTQMQV